MIFIFKQVIKLTSEIDISLQIQLDLFYLCFFILIIVFSKHLQFIIIIIIIIIIITVVVVVVYFSILCYFPNEPDQLFFYFYSPVIC